jgi:hypothetical protein
MMQLRVEEDRGGLGEIGKKMERKETDETSRRCPLIIDSKIRSKANLD